MNDGTEATPAGPEDMAALTALVEASNKEAEKPIFIHPKFYAVSFVGGDSPLSLVPIKRCKVTDAALADAEITEGLLNETRMQIHVVRDPAVMDKIKPYAPTLP